MFGEGRREERVKEGWSDGGLEEESGREGRRESPAEPLKWTAEQLKCSGGVTEVSASEATEG